MRAADLFPYRHEVRAGTLQAVQNLPDEHLEWKPTAGVHSIMGWLRHIAQSEDWWIQHGVLGRADFTPKRKTALYDRGQVLEYLAQTRATTERLLAEWPAQKLQETRPSPMGMRAMPRGPELTLHWIMGNLFDHERHHRAQIYLYLRLMGLEPPLY